MVEPLGNVFKGIPGETNAPVWSFEDPTSRDGKARTAVYTCPVSAVPREVWRLFSLWNESRLMGLPVRAGGLEDQPAAVRLSFPIFQHEFNMLQMRNGAMGAQTAAVSAAGMMLQGIFGGKR